MKKIYLTFSFLSVFFLSFSQGNFTYSKLNTDRTNHIADLPINKPTNNSQLLLKTVVLTEDFESVTAPALPTGWTTYNVGTPTDGVFETGDDAAANVGGYWPVPTHTNFAMVNDDVCNCDMNEVYLQLPDVDLTGLSSIALSYESFDDGTYGGNPHEVEVSIDGGTTWTNIHTHTHNTTNWTTVAVMLGASTDNQAQVSIRLKYSDAGGWATGVAFDDVAVASLQNNNLALTTGVFQSFGLPYYMVPTTQVTAIDLFGTVDNIGVLDQPNTVLSCDVDGAAFGTSAPVTVAAGTVGDTLVISTQYTPAATVGTHSFDFSVASDSVDADPANNAIAAGSMEVTDYIYARDNSVDAGGSYNQGNAFEMGNYFDVFADQDMYSINVKIHSAAEVGAVVYGVVYSVDAATGDFIFEQNTDDYVLTSGDLGAEIQLNLFSPFTLLSGNGYLVVIGGYGDGGATNDLVVTTAGISDPQTSFFYDGTDLTWYYTTSTPWVRINTENTQSIEESNVNFVLDQNIPNPFNNNSVINYTLNEASNVSFKIVDITGKIVMDLNEGTLSSGAHTITLNADVFAKGVYHYTLSTEKGSLTKTMIVTE
jgi:hypothetical protein